MDTINSCDTEMLLEAIRVLGRFGAHSVLFENNRAGKNTKRLLAAKVQEQEKIKPRPYLRILPIINGSEWFGVTVRFDEAQHEPS